MLKLVHVPNPILITPARPVEKITKKIKKIISDMEASLRIHSDPPGVGLAAPQVGVGLRIFIMKPAEDAKCEVSINPKILQTKGEAQPLRRPKKARSATSRLKKPQRNPDEGDLEGCLSIPRIWAPLKRPQKVYLEWTNLEEENKKQWFSGFRAVIVQHETDHINGILFTQKALSQNAQFYREVNGKLVKEEL